MKNRRVSDTSVFGGIFFYGLFLSVVLLLLTGGDFEPLTWLHRHGSTL